MQVGVIGLGKMGAGVAERLIKGGHEVFVYNRTAEKAIPLTDQGARAFGSIEELVQNLPSPRIIWLYLPSGEVTSEHVHLLHNLLQSDDILIDGGNSRYTSSITHAQTLLEKGIHFLDCGTSGGTAGRTQGYCLMVGGEAQTFQRVESLLQVIAQENAYRHIGPAGAGHYVKMVHNAIEYGMMQAYGEGLELLQDGQYANQLNLADISDLWQHGSIIRSYLGQLLTEAFQEDAGLTGVAGEIDDNGEGQWTVQEALEKKIPVPVISAALFARYTSKRPNAFAYKVVSVLRKKFGGHPIKATNG